MIAPATIDRGSGFSSAAPFRGAQAIKNSMMQSSTGRRTA
jgi:hypothetical protein